MILSGYKNKILVQKCRINVAKAKFDDFMFDWNSFPIKIHASAMLSAYLNYKKLNNMDELSLITMESAEIEWNNLINSYEDSNNINILICDIREFFDVSKKLVVEF